MRARDLVSRFPTVSMGTPVAEAARELAVHNLPGLVVVDGEDRPVTILPGTQVLRMAVPAYCLDDPALARVVDEPTADLFLTGLAGRTVSECLPDRRAELAVIDPDATLLEIAVLMARTCSPLVAVVDDAGTMTGAVTLDALLDRRLAA
jgi:predicted transcriptional regulator